MATDIRTHPNGTASDADFQGFVAAIDAAILAVGWTRTADTGQINAATVTNPAAATYAGYAMYQMTDALQATKPVLVRVDFVNSQPNSCHGVNVTLGLAGSNGAGLLNSPKSSVLVARPFYCPVSSTFSLRTSGASNRLTLFGGLGAPFTHNNGYGAGGSGACSDFGFSVERSHNDDGTDSGDGAFLVVRNCDTIAYPSGNTNYSGNHWDCHYVAFDGSNGPSVGAAAQPGGVGANRLPMPWYDSGTMVVGLNVGVVPLFMPKSGVRNPSICLAGYRSSDVATDLSVVVTEYGAPRTFRTVGAWLNNMSNAGVGGATTGDAGAGCLMRWE